VPGANPRHHRTSLDHVSATLLVTAQLCMSSRPGYHNRQPVLAANICNLFYSLDSSTYGEIAPKIEYWIEYVITELLDSSISKPEYFLDEERQS
jgi:hypothetical protein